MKTSCATPRAGCSRNAGPTRTTGSTGGQVQDGTAPRTIHAGQPARQESSSSAPRHDDDDQCRAGVALRRGAGAEADLRVARASGPACGISRDFDILSKRTFFRTQLEVRNARGSSSPQDAATPHAGPEARATRIAANARSLTFERDTPDYPAVSAARSFPRAPVFSRK